VPGIGKLLSERLHAAGLGSLRQLAAADPRRIEAVTQRHYPFGALLEAAVPARGMLASRRNLRQRMTRGLHASRQAIRWSSTSAA